MASPAPPQLLVVGQPTGDSSIRSWLEPFGYSVEQRPPRAIPDIMPSYVALILDCRSGPSQDMLTLCKRFALRGLDDRPPILYFAPDDSVASRLVGFSRGADAVVARSATAEELLAQIRVLERWNNSRHQWLARAAEANQINQQLQQAYQQIEMDLHMARRLQASFLPRTLPNVERMRFAVSYRPCGQVGGDFYDVFRLDEQHVGFYVADAMGHGVPASLLTVFLKKAVQSKEVSGSSYRLLAPEEVLTRLNRELIAQGLAELPFITMVYGLLNCRDGRLQFARAAHPYPVYLPSTGEPEQWQSPGTLLGIFEAEYVSQKRTLQVGDKLLVFTDGLQRADERAGCPEPLLKTAVQLRSLPIDALVDQLSSELVSNQPQSDDFTMLGIEVRAA